LATELAHEGHGPGPQAQKPSRSNEHALVPCPATDGRVPDEGPAQSDCFERECASGVGAVAVRHLVATPSLVAAGIVELVADGGGAGNAGEGGGEGGVEYGVGLVVAVVAGLALNPDDVTAGVYDHVLVRCRASDSYSDKILSATFLRSRNDVGSKGRFFYRIRVSMGVIVNERGYPFGVPFHSLVEAGGVICGRGGADFISVQKLHFPISLLFF